jgi:hypothetical protein
MAKKLTKAERLVQEQMLALLEWATEHPTKWPPGSGLVLDDLERANCPLAGTLGHWGCGWCPHDKPRWLCVECLGPG